MADKSVLEQAKEHIQLLELEVKRLTQPPYTFAPVLRRLDDERLLVGGGQGPVVIGIPDLTLIPEELKTNDLIKEIKKIRQLFHKSKSGDLILLNGAGAPVDLMAVELSGMEATVKRVFEGDQMELDSGMGGAGVVVWKGQVAECVKAGDTVLLDRSGSVAMRIVPKDRSAHSVETATGVTWADIGGQDEAKRVLLEAIIEPMQHVKFFTAYNKKAIKGCLLSGPPGCGKTLLAKAVANAVREAHGKDESATGFIYVKGPEVLNMWVGNTEAQIRGLFSQAKEHQEQYGYPAVLFIDEADAILGKRGSHHASVLSSTVVPTFLAEMDGLVDSGAFVLLATNRPDTLDPAITREGRIDRKVPVGRPGVRESAQILSIHLRKTKVAHGTDCNELAGDATAELFSDTHVLYRVGLKGKGMHAFHMKHLVSGALLAGIVDQAASVAIQRDVKVGKVSGVNQEDMRTAVVQVVKSNRGLNHEDDLHLFAEAHGAELEGVQRIAA